MLKAFQKEIILESAAGQADRNRALEARVLAYLATEDLTLQDMFDVADAVENVFVPKYTCSMALVMNFSQGQIVTLKRVLNYEHIEIDKKQQKVSTLPQANKVRNLFLELKGLAFIA